MGKKNDLALVEYRMANMIRLFEGLNRKRKYPLERAHYLLLLHLRDGSMSVGALASELALDNSTVTRQLNAMEKRGLIEKHANPDDGRSFLIGYSEYGKKMVEEMQKLRLDRVEELFKEWSDEEVSQLSRLFGKLTDSTVNVLQSLDETIKQKN